MSKLSTQPDVLRKYKENSCKWLLLTRSLQPVGFDMLHINLTELFYVTTRCLPKYQWCLMTVPKTEVQVWTIVYTKVVFKSTSLRYATPFSLSNRFFTNISSSRRTRLFEILVVWLYSPPIQKLLYTVLIKSYSVLLAVVSSKWGDKIALDMALHH